MKKIQAALTLVLTAALSWMAPTAQAQTTGDKINFVINDNGTEKTEQMEISELYKISHNTSTMDVYDNVFGDFFPASTYNIGDVKKVSFSFVNDQPVPDANAELVDAQATEQTKRLFSYLQRIYGAKTLSGVTAEVNWNHRIADQIYQATGKYPAINVYDFIHIATPDGNGWINYNDITPVTEWAEQGGIVSLMWHFNVPLSESTVIGRDGSGQTCTPSETTFKASNALVDGTWENKYFYEQMGRVADVMLKLQDNNIAAIWRPFHEAAGNYYSTQWKGEAWFWWGEDGPETFKGLWKAMYEYFQDRGVHNLIWEWTAQNYNGSATGYTNDEAYYPGDAYVDMVGRDLYGVNAQDNATEFSQLTGRYLTKIVALSECGTNNGAACANVGDAWDAGARWLYFAPWYGSNLPANSWWQNAFADDRVITRDEVNLNTFYVAQSAKDAVAMMGLGWNLGNTLDSNGSWMESGRETAYYETAWGQPLATEALFKFLKKEGFSSVRIPVTWYNHLDAEGNVAEAWMNRVQEVVDYAINSGLYVILNVHHDTGADEAAANGFKSWVKADLDNYAANHARYENLWKQIAERFADYDHHLLFEGYNEMLNAANSWNVPSSTDNAHKALSQYAQSFVTTVRATGGNNATRNLIVNTYASANDQNALDGLTLPNDPAKGHLAVEVHTYAPWDWFATYGAWNNTCSTEIKNMFNRLNNKYSASDIPFIVGEYGTHGSQQVSKTSTAAQIKAAADQAADLVKQARDNGSATFYWMSILDGADRSVPQWTLPTVVEAMKAACVE